MVHFTKISSLYLEKQQIPVTKNDHAMWKSPGNIAWVKALAIKMCKKEPPKL
jgi:hypothetical protein